MTAVVFETPGLLDVRAITIMGAHAKPNSSNPIGFFGTGLKYAIAVAVRLGAEPVIWIGRDRFSFTARQQKFRGANLETIKMTVLKDGNKRPTTYELGFTTRYGARWKPWMAFRELESNTRDEGGKTYTVDGSQLQRERLDIYGKDGVTRVVVDHPEFVEAAEAINTIFLPRGRRSGKLLEAFPGESDHAYYRTMRALELGKPSLFTYNVLEELELTEDRTIKYNFQLQNIVAKWVLTEATPDQVEVILKADEDHWEHELDFPTYDRPAPSAAFTEVMTTRQKPAPKILSPERDAKRPRIEGTIARSAYSYFAPYAREAVRPQPTQRPWRLSEAHPRPWRVEGLEVLDANGTAVLAAPDSYYEGWELVAHAVVARVNVGLGARPETGIAALEEAAP